MKTKLRLASLFLFGFVILTGCGSTDPDPVVQPEPNDPLPRDELVAFYSFNGNARDASGFNNHGTAAGAALTADRFGNPNSAFLFDGVDDYIDVGNSASLKPAFPITIAVWFRIDENKGSALFTTNFDHDVNNGVWIALSADRTMAISYGDGGPVGRNSRKTRHSAKMFSTETWHHFVGVIHDEGEMDVYIDGRKDNGAYSGTASSLHYSAGPGNFGRRDSGTSTEPIYFQGAIDGLMIYNRVLTDNEITKVYNYRDVQE